MKHHSERGMLNKGSSATQFSWSWDDFSEAISFLAKEYAAEMPLRDVRARPASRFQVACEVAEMECAMNSRFCSTGYGGRDALFHYLASPGSAYLDRVIRGMIPFALLEVETGYSCQPKLICGLDAMVYPVILPIIQNRIRKSHTLI